jgi:hypothetical protein
MSKNPLRHEIESGVVDVVIDHPPTNLVDGAFIGALLALLDELESDLAARVIVPGLRPHWARFAPGRLYDVPVRSKDLTEPTRYEDLNPVPLFL